MIYRLHETNSSKPWTMVGLEDDISFWNCLSSGSVWVFFSESIYLYYDTLCVSFSMLKVNLPVPRFGNRISLRIFRLLVGSRTITLKLEWISYMFIWNWRPSLVDEHMLEMFGTLYTKFMQSWMNVDYNFNQLNIYIYISGISNR